MCAYSLTSRRVPFINLVPHSGNYVPVQSWAGHNSFESMEKLDLLECYMINYKLHNEHHNLYSSPDSIMVVK
jgi:hypothetical protein